jgi:hypothetical protein
MRKLLLVAGFAAAILAPSLASAKSCEPPRDKLAASGQISPGPECAPAGSDKASSAEAAAAVGVNTSVVADANGDRRLLVASTPVPDTTGNRMKYGAPLSHAGRQTKPIGN